MFSLGIPSSFRKLSNFRSRNDTVVRALVSHQCGLGSIPFRRHMLVGFVVGSRHAPEGYFPASLVLLPPQKPVSPNLNSIRIVDLYDNKTTSSAEVALRSKCCNFNYL